ncbi:MAG TPA: SDR family NAD(P)-dependent oxidoreductase [Bryobacteraceae bacterium]|nr:SDR family NAD(P)-dependent oxidoreductase [Bryobacteraceae bacterium]
MRFQNKVAIVTGGASGIGRAMCEEFARRGATVAVADIHFPKAEEVAAGRPRLPLHAHLVGHYPCRYPRITRLRCGRSRRPAPPR